MNLSAPRHGKTEFNTIICSGWYHGMFPRHRVVIASYGASLAAWFSEQVRSDLEYFGEDTFGVRVKADARARDNFRIEYIHHDPDGKRYEWRPGGGMLAIGVGGGFAGKGADLLILDDLVADAEEAQSEASRNKVKEWYHSVAKYRMEPGGIKCFTMTPWHPLDIGGHILTTEATKWRVLRLPALAEAYDPTKPSTNLEGYDRFLNQPDPLGRQPGEALWPERFDKAYLEDLRDSGEEGLYWFNNLFQCSPKQRGLEMFKEEWFTKNYVDAAPAKARRCRHWDKAATEGGGDWTVGFKVSVLDGIYYLEDMVRGQWGGTRRQSIQLATAADDGIRCIVSIEKEMGSSGKDMTEIETKAFAGYIIKTPPATKSKAIRAEALSIQLGAGNVKIVRAPWNKVFIRECCEFPNGKHDDCVDAASGAFNQLALAKRGGYSMAGGDVRLPANFPSQY